MFMLDRRVLLGAGSAAVAAAAFAPITWRPHTRAF
jgi:hypothetical protein